MIHNFSWIVPDRVGGMARPHAGDDAEWLVERGVTAVVSLTMYPPEDLGPLEILHLPVADMTAPTLDQLHAAATFMREVVEKGGKVVAHCGAGMGRTGTALAAYLVSGGMPAGEAIGRVRSLRPGSIETPGQENVVHEYAEFAGA